MLLEVVIAGGVWHAVGVKQFPLRVVVECGKRAGQAVRRASAVGATGALVVVATELRAETGAVRCDVAAAHRVVAFVACRVGALRRERHGMDRHWQRGRPCDDHRERAQQGWWGWARLGSALCGPRRAESSSFVAVTVHPFPMRPRSHRRHAAPQIEPEALHPEIDDEPLESQIERARPLRVLKRLVDWQMPHELWLQLKRLSAFEKQGW